MLQNCIKISQRLALAFWAAFIAMILFEAVFFQPWMESSAYFFSTALFLSGLALGWVLADSNENNLNIPKLLGIFIVAAPFVAVPYYRFRYFGAKAGLKFLGIVLLNFIGVVLVDFALQFLPVHGGAA